MMYSEQIENIKLQIKQLERELKSWHRTSEISQRLTSIPGVGVITATAMAATINDMPTFKSGRAFAAWLGLTPKSASSGGKVCNGRVSKAGDRHLRALLVLGATSVIRRVRAGQSTPLYSWAKKLLDRKPARLTTVALANKIARISWAVMAKNTTYQPEKAAA